MKNELLEAWDKAWNKGEVDALDVVFSENYIRTDLLDKNTLDRDGMKALILKVRHSFPDMHTTPLQIIEDDDSVAIFWRSTATHKGEYYGVPPTGKAIYTSGASIYIKQDGWIVKEIESWDSRNILAALGIMSLPSTQDSD